MKCFIIIINKDAIIPTIIEINKNVLAFVLNVFFNYIFIFGKFGMPQMGLTGAAVGTVISRIVEFLIFHL